MCIEVAQKQLEQYYNSINVNRGIRVTIRKWSITVWLAMIITIATGKITLNSWHRASRLK